MCLCVLHVSWWQQGGCVRAPRRTGKHVGVLATAVDAPLVGVGGGGDAVSAAVYGCVAATVPCMPWRACEQEKVRAGNTHVVVWYVGVAGGESE
jgi:hypothetical protein